MRGFRVLVVVVSPLLLALAVESFAQQPATKSYKVVTPKDDRLSAVDINGKGDIVGTEWVEEKQSPDMVVEVPFLAQGKRMIRIPLLKGYTSTFPAAVSDTGVVVGRASKPGSFKVRVLLRNQAFVWDEKNGIQGLGALEGDIASLATGISRDGARISGYSVGEGRLRPCVWDRDGHKWVGVALPHEGLLTSMTVAISSDGRLVTASDAGVPCVWSRDARGQWTREAVGKNEELIPRAVNNAKTVVGYTHVNGKKRAVVSVPEKGCRQLPLPAGFSESEALDVNNDGVIVGWLERLTEKGKEPAPFVALDGKLNVIQSGGPNFISATSINDDWLITGLFEHDEEEEK